MRNRTNRLKKSLLALGLAVALAVTGAMIGVTGAAEAQNTTTTPDLMNPGDLPGPWGTCYGATMYAHKEKCESWGRQDLFGTEPGDDPAFCNSECHRCCDEYGGLDGFDQVLLHASCECLISAIATEGVSLFGCVAPTLLSSAKAMGFLSQEEYEELAADPLFLLHMTETMAEIMAGPIELAFVHNWLQGLPPHLANELRVETVSKMFRGMSVMILASMEMCHNLDSLMENIFHLECEEQCGQWFYRPSGNGGGGEDDDDDDGGGGGTPGGGATMATGTRDRETTAIPSAVIRSTVRAWARSAGSVTSADIKASSTTTVTARASRWRSATRRSTRSTAGSAGAAAGGGLSPRGIDALNGFNAA